MNTVNPPNPIEFTISEVYSEAWNFVKDNLFICVGLSVVHCLVSLAVSSVPFVGWLIAASLFPGYILSLMRLKQGKSVTFEKYFWVFQDLERLLNYVLAYVAVLVVTVLGLILLIVPGVYFGLSTAFFWYPMLFSKLSPMEAIAHSQRTTKGFRWKIFFFVLVLIGVYLLGLLFFGVGVFFAVPLNAVATVIFYEKIAGRSDWLLVDEDPETAIPVTQPSV